LAFFSFYDIIYLMKRFYLYLLVFSIFMMLVACSSSTTQRVLLEVDDTRRWIAIAENNTVGDVLLEADVQLGLLDRVEPPSFTLLEPEMQIRIIRVRQGEVSSEELLPFPREVRRDASLPQGESRLIQLGENGRGRVIYTTTLEDGVEVERKYARRELLIKPISEVLVVGTRGAGETNPFEGSIAYLEQGNAWLMRGDSTQKRALTSLGDLDGHVFALSPTGQWLLFSRQPLGGASGQGGPLNTLWLSDTRLINEEPRPLNIDSLLWADWQACSPTQASCPLRIAYSTAERMPTPPGWRANNDLWSFSVDSEGQREAEIQLRAPSNALFGWWGRHWKWSPNGEFIAWGDATRIGLVELDSQNERILAEFTPFETFAAWVWTPQLSWSPDSSSLLATIHQPASDGTAEQTSAQQRQRFDLIRFDLSKDKVESLIEQVGPFAMPRWLDDQTILYGQVEDKTLSVTSRYHLMLYEENEANDRRTEKVPLVRFPLPGNLGVDVPWAAWDPLDDAFVAVWQGDLYLVPLEPSLPPQPLTAEGGASRPLWGP
jgi:hypothetical protein